MKTAEPAPFYLPSNPQVPSASQIISEAKASLLRPSRPFTPAPTNRASLSKSYLIEPLAPDSLNKSFLRKFAIENRLPVKLQPLEKQNIFPGNGLSSEQIPPKSPKSPKSLKSIRTPKPPAISGYSRPSTPLFHEQSEETSESDSTLIHSQNMLARSKSIAHLDSFLKLAPENDQRWRTVTNLIRKLVINGELEPIYGYLTESNWLKKYSRPISASRTRAAREAKKLKEANKLQKNEDSSDIEKLASSEKAIRVALVKWLIEWCSDSECTDSIIAATCLLIRLTRDEENLELCLRKFFKLTMDTYRKPHPLVVESLASFSKQYQVRRKSNVLIYACGIFRNWSEVSETHDLIVSQNMVPFFHSAIAELAAETTINDTSERIKSPIDATGLSTYARLISQIVVCLRNLNKNNEIQYTPQLIQDLCTFVLKSNRLNEDEHVMLMIFKLLGTLSESKTFQVTLGQPHFVKAYAEQLIHCIDKPDILTRLAYILGNLTTFHNETHTILQKSFYDIVNVFKKVQEDYVEVMKSETASQITKVYSDLFLKMTRLIANLALEKKIGDSMIRMAEFDSLLNFADDAEQELSLNIIWLVANISFYATPGSRSFTNLYLNINKIIPRLISDNEEMVTESCRIIANLSRYPLPAPPQTMQRLMEVISLLLDHSRPTILELTCGILVNLLKATKNIQYFIIYDGHEKLFNLLEWSLEKDKKAIIGLAMQGIFNLRKNTEKQVLSEKGIDARVLQFPPQIRDQM